MLPLLEKLLILQDRDIRLINLNKEIARIPEEEKLIDQRIKSQSQGLDQHILETKQIESQRKQLELEVAGIQSTIAKYKIQQSQTKKNEEYQMYTHEIEKAENKIREIEDGELALMEKYEVEQKETSKEKDVVKQFESSASKEKSALKERLAGLEKQKEEALADIAAAEKEVPDTSVLAKYRRIITNKGDKAIVPIISNCNCGGCNLKLTPQVVITAKQENELTSCINCGRFVYWQY